MPKAFLYAGKDAKVLTALREGMLLRGYDQPRWGPRPQEWAGEIVGGVEVVFVDGPPEHLQAVVRQLDRFRAKAPVVWIAQPMERQLASPELLDRLADLWDRPIVHGGWTLPGEDRARPLPETPILEPTGISPVEANRIAYLESKGHLQQGREKRFNRLSRWLADYFDADEAMVNLIGKQMKLVKGSSGRGEVSDEVARESTICQYVMAGDQPVVVPDIGRSEFCRDKGIQPGPDARSYAGVPMRNGEDVPLGSVCMMASEARTLTLADVEIMSAIARCATDALVHSARDSDRMLIKESAFQQLVEALLRDSERALPLCVAVLPVSAAEAPWDQGLEFVTITGGWQCLVCLPQASPETARTRLAALLPGADLEGRIVAARPGRTWESLQAEVAALVP